MKRFEHREVREAIAHAEAGGQALHVWPADPRFPAPSVFRRSRFWGHLIDHDHARLVETARELGVRVIKVGRLGERGQHIDLCGKPLERALALCGGV